MQMYGVAQLGLARARGDVEPLIPLLETMVEQFPLIPSWGCGLAYVHRDVGDLANARVVFDRFASTGFDLPRDANWLVGVSLLGVVAHSLGDVDAAAALHDLLLPMADTCITAGMPADYYGSTHAPLALLAVTLDRWDDAQRHYDAAIAANDRLGCRSWNLYTQLEWGRVLVGRGDSAAAGDLLRLVRSEAQQTGMTRVEPLAGDLLDGLDGGSSATA
jgi:hypothetical protein